MVFGAVEAVKKDLQSRMPLHELIRGMSWKQVVKALDERGLSQFQIGMVLKAEQKKLNKTTSAWVLDYECDPNWPRHDIEAINNLRKLGLVDTINDRRYVLTAAGRQLREATKVIHERAKEITGVNYNTDINLSRDGLLTTCSKIAWVLGNQEAIKSHRMERFLKEFGEGQSEIDKALHRIVTAEQRVARLLIEQGPPALPESYWDEEDQRDQNDVYWMSGGSAFWLNPRGALADPTPAPEWWSPPVNYQSLVQQQITARLENDVVGKSLLPPPEAPKSEADIICGLLEELKKKEFESPRETYLDDLLSGIDDSDECDDFESWKTKHEVAKPKNHEKIRTGSNHKGAIVTASFGNLFIVEFEGNVRGFNNRLEAETYIGEQRTLIQQRAEVQKVAEAKRLQQNKYQKNEYKGETYKSKNYKSIMKESYNEPYTGGSSKELN